MDNLDSGVALSTQSSVPMDIYIRSDDPWYDDGTIVLEANQTVFRVFRGILANNSLVFRDLFSFPQPTDTSTSDAELYDGCVVIHMPDDADELGIFLKAIHDADFYLEHVPVPMPTVKAVLRLATKYDVSYLRQRAIHQLSSIYPTTLADYDAQVYGGSKSLILDAADPFEMANLAREMQVLSFLPVILYRCITVTGLAALADPNAVLNAADRQTCLNAADALRRQFMHALSTANSKIVTGCSKQCLNFIVTIHLAWDSVMKATCEVLNRPLPPEGYVTLWKTPCHLCCVEWHNVMLDLRRSSWAELPQTFGLPGWEELVPSPPTE